MPAYSYACGCGHKFVKVMPVRLCSVAKRCEKCGEQAERDIVADHREVAHKPGNWPMTSEAAGVHPDDAKRAEEISIQAGVPTKFNADGTCEFTSARHRKTYLESQGLYDRNGGYSAAQRR